jgi:hypothetical protein
MNVKCEDSTKSIKKALYNSSYILSAGFELVFAYFDSSFPLSVLAFFHICSDEILFWISSSLRS